MNECATSQQKEETMSPTLTLTDLLKLSILQAEEMQSLTGDKSYTKRDAYRKLLRESAWNAVMRAS